MIIRCRKCETSFRFEDQLMVGEGVWVRCSRCRNVFFQDNPSYEEKTLPVPDAAVKLNGSGGIAPEAAATASGLGEVVHAEEIDPILSRVDEIREAMAASTPVAGRPLKKFDEPEDLSAWESREDDVEAWPEPKSGLWKGRLRGVVKFFAYLLLVMFIAIFFCGLYFWYFPEHRQVVVDSLAAYIPGAEILGKKQPHQSDIAAQISLQDLRQHFVNNWLTGSLRVVEGTLINKGNSPVTRIQVRGRIYDAAGNVLGEWISFGGNILTDTELAALSEEEIRHRLSQPLLSNMSKDRVSPRGQIPFMVVITHHDQQAVAKTTLAVSGAEKLLE